MRSRDSLRVSRARNSIVPNTFPSSMMGKHIAERMPCRRAIAALGNFSSPKSATKTRSRDFQARPGKPSPSGNRASDVARRNSSLTEPLSTVNLSTFSLGSSVQNEP